MTCVEALLDGVPRRNVIYEVPKQCPQKMNGESSSLFVRYSVFLDWLLHSGNNEKMENVSETKPQATEQHQNPVKVKAKSYVFWSTDYAALQSINVKVYKTTNKYSHWQICRLTHSV